MKNVPNVLGSVHKPSVETKSPAKQIVKASTPKQGYTGKLCLFGNIDGTISNDAKSLREWDFDSFLEE